MRIGVSTKRAIIPRRRFREQGSPSELARRWQVGELGERWLCAKFKTAFKLRKAGKQEKSN
jgi:hypothetical protein